MLKFGGAAIATAFAILGVLFDFRDKATGKVTRVGLASIAGTVVSALVAIWSDQINQWQSNKRTIAELKRHGELLSEIRKTLEPIGVIKIQYSIYIESSEASIINYLHRIEAGALLYATAKRREFWSEFPIPNVPLGLEPVVTTRTDIEVLRIRGTTVFSPKSIQPPFNVGDEQMLPAGDESLAYSLLTPAPQICFRSTPTSDLKRCNYPDGDADLIFLTKGVLRNHFIKFSVNTEDIGQSRTKIRVNITNIEMCDYLLMQDISKTLSNGMIASIPDLRGTQVIVFLRAADIIRREPPPYINSWYAEEPKIDTQATKVYAGWLDVHVSGGNYHFDATMLDVAIANNGVYFSAKFPSTAHEMTKLKKDPMKPEIPYRK